MDDNDDLNKNIEKEEDVDELVKVHAEDHIIIKDKATNKILLNRRG